MSENISINECNNEIKNSDKKSQTKSFIKSITKGLINNTFLIPRSKKQKLDNSSNTNQTEAQAQSAEYRKEYNNDELTDIVNTKLGEILKHLNDNNIDPNTLSDEYWNELLCGFFDGDGCLFVTKDGYIRIIFYQSRRDGHPPELVFIRDYIIKRLRTDGIISASEAESSKLYHIFSDASYDPDAIDDRFINDNEDTNKRRPSHSLVFGKREIVSYILNNILVKLALKQPQRQLALQHLNNIETINRSENKAEIIETFYKAMSQTWGLKSLEAYQKVYINPEYITYAYITGFFIAEGCISISFYDYERLPRLYIKYAQKQSDQLLICIGIKLNIKLTLNSTNFGELALQDPDAITAIVAMWPFLSATDPISAKGQQVRVMLEQHQVYLDLRMSKMNKLSDEVYTQLRAQLYNAIGVITSLKKQ